MFPLRATTAALLLVALAGCGGERPTVQVCGRGDRDLLAEALAGGRLELTFRDGDGRVVAEISAAADRPSDLLVSIPEEARSVAVTGLDASGTAIAEGAAPVADGRACVCLALSGQHRAACEGITCEVEDDRCSFFDASGAPAGRRTLVLGENPGDDVAGVTADTSLSRAPGAEGLNFGGDGEITVTGEPAGTGLLRFDLSGLPRSSVIERAEFLLTTCAGPCAAAGQLALFPVIEPWQEGDGAGEPGCASWNCRQEGVAWSVPGCGFLSDDDRSREATAVAQAVVAGPDSEVAFDVTGLVAGWVADPSSNHGVAIAVDDNGSVALLSSEAAAGSRPRLQVTFSIPDEVGEDEPVDAGVPEAADAGDDLPEMVRVPAGAFVMGCVPRDGLTCPDNAVPAHAVNLPAFDIDTTEVTQAAYAACVEAGKCSEPACNWDPEARPNYPVTCVSFLQARDHCAFAGKRLPTEAEWEKAARGTDGRIYPWGDEPPTCSRANGFGCAGAPQPVGLRPAGASPYGALDMAGNANEIVHDRFSATYYQESPTDDPQGPSSGNRRVRRGGGYGGNDDMLKSYWRTGVGQDVMRDTSGFRCARDAE